MVRKVDLYKPRKHMADTHSYGKSYLKHWGDIKTIQGLIINGHSLNSAVAYHNQNTKLEKDKINRSTLQGYLDDHAELKEYVLYLKGVVGRKAIENLSLAIGDGNLEISRWYLERRDPKFANKSDNRNFNINVEKKLDEHSIKKIEEYDAIINTDGVVKENKGGQHKGKRPRTKSKATRKKRTVQVKKRRTTRKASK